MTVIGEAVLCRYSGSYFLERDVAVLAGRTGNVLVGVQAQVTCNHLTGLRWQDNCVDKPALCCLVRVEHVVFVFTLEGLSQLGYVQALFVCLLEFLAVDEADSTGSTHHSDLRGWPGP